MDARGPEDGVVRRKAAAVVASVSFERARVTSDGQRVKVRLNGQLEYDPADPYAVTVAIFDGQGPVRWTVSRDLLLGGCYVPAGEGDIRIRPCADAGGRPLTRLEFRSPGGTAVLTTATENVAAFCRRIVASVPPGTESDHLDLDEEIHRLLADDSWPWP